MKKRASELMTRDMAQHVIDTIKPTVRHNINIMDAHGVIIAAVDPERVGTHHAGALQAVAAQGPVEIWDRDDATGVRPGVNIPLWHDDTVRGVVGLTGNPDEVRSTAELIALTVELLLTQERQINDDVQRDTQARDVLAALSSGASDPIDLTSRLSAASLPGPWTLSVSLNIDAQDPSQTVAQGRLNDRLRRLNRTPGVLAAELFGAVWTLRSSVAVPRAGKAVDDRRIFVPAVSSIEQLQVQAVGLRHACAYPGLFPAAMAPAESADAQQPLLWRWEIASAVAVMHRPAIAHRADMVAKLTQEQCRTVLALGECTSSHAAAAGLYIHRNTMAQRIDQIIARTEHDPRIGVELSMLLLAVYARAALGDLHIFGP